MNIPTATADGGSSLVPADVRLANLLRIVGKLGGAGPLSRSEVGRQVGLSLPTVHRLVSDLERLGLVTSETAKSRGRRPGRPASLYSFREEAAVLLGVDLGNETSRLSLTTLAGDVLAARSFPSFRLGANLNRGLTREALALLHRKGVPKSRLAGAGVGVAAVVDSVGVLRAPPEHKDWDGVALGAGLREALGCDVFVAQDDHLSPIAESSERGTFPGTSSLLVLEVGRGIGVGLTVNGTPVIGAQGRFGRVANWPLKVATQATGRTLGEGLVTSGLVAQYHLRGGSAAVTDGLGLATAARAGDRRAQAVFKWAAVEIANLVTCFQHLCDPQAIVIGGGLSQAYDLLAPEMDSAPGLEASVAPSVLGDQAVVVGAVIVARSYAESWLLRRLARDPNTGAGP